MAKADEEANPEVYVVDRLVEALPQVDGEPDLAVFERFPGTPPRRGDAAGPSTLRT